MRPDARRAFAAYVVFLVVVLVPWTSFQRHSHWAFVNWVPFAPPLHTRDMAVNVLLFVPFGALCRKARSGTHNRLWPVVAVGCLFSMAAELSQVYSHGRFPSMTDVATNTIGSALGAWLAGRAL